MGMSNDLGIDCISRARAIERLKLNLPISQGADNSRDRHRYMQALADIQAIRELPSVTPQEPKTGHWIDGHCSECGCDIPAYIIDWKWQKDMDAKYCPNCGCRMVESQKSEE